MEVQMSKRSIWRAVAFLTTAAMTVPLAGAYAPVAMFAEAAAVEESDSNSAADAAAPENGSISAAKTDASFRVWQTDTHLAICREDQLREEAGLTLDEWDASVEEMKREGLSKALSPESILESDPAAEILKENDRVYFIGTSSAFEPAASAQETYRTAYSLIDMLGGSEDTDLRLWSEQECNDKTVYSFQQISGTEEILESTMKIVTDAGGNVMAVFSSILPDRTVKEKRVTREQAEAAVVEYMDKQKGVRTKAISGLTERMPHSQDTFAEALDLEEDTDPIPQQVLWIVYTKDASVDPETGKEYPYLAHYVTLEGEYLYNLPVTEPGSREAKSGYRMQNVFEGMIPGEFTGEVTDGSGNRKTVTVPVMQNENDGKWYLGDPVRKIAVADFYSAAYEDTHDLKLIGNDANTDWDNEDLYMYDNFIRAWDFYADMGWVAPDGRGTDTIILKDLCYRNRSPYANACYVGLLENYQVFGYTSYNQDGTPLRLVQALDVMAHEYTHAFTTTVMNQNLYENDQGAINEAMSDIMGNLTEYICEDTTDKKWELGEHTEEPIRSMSDPHKYGQPEYVWDVYYGTHTDNPNVVNDRGGVHYNSSLLNKIAADLCLDHDMVYPEAVSFWTLVSGGLTPETDYVQICALLRWAITASGNEKYLDALNTLIGEMKLEEQQFPEALPVGQKQVILKLPDTEAFEDEHWALMGFQLNSEKLLKISGAVAEIIFGLLEAPEDTGRLFETINRLTEDLHFDGKELTIGDLSVDTEDPDALTDLIKEFKSDLLRTYVAWESGEGREISMVTYNGPTLYVLMNLTRGGSELSGFAVLLGARWYDVLGSVKWLNEKAKEFETLEEDEYPAVLEEMKKEAEQFFRENIIGDGARMVKEKVESTLRDLLSEEEPHGETVFLPVEGLENVQLGAMHVDLSMPEEE